MQLRKWPQLYRMAHKNQPDKLSQLTESWELKACHWFKPLSFGVICYIAIDNLNILWSHPDTHQSYTFIWGPMGPTQISKP